MSYLVGDVTAADDNARMVETVVVRYGGVEIFLANAGIEEDVASILDYDEARFDQVMAVNEKGPFLAVRAAVPAMQVRGGGSIIIASSGSGVRGTPRMAPHAISKHAVIGLMRSAAREFAAEGIRVNTVNPFQAQTRVMRSIEAGMPPDDPVGA